MTKLVVKNLRSETRHKILDTLEGLKKKNVIGATGRRVIYSVDSSSPNFGRGLERIFKRNVEKARRDNKRVLGVADRSPRA